MKKIIILSLTMTAVGLLNTIPASAITYQNNTDVDFTLNPTINLTLSGDSGTDLIIDNLAPGSASDSNIITATVSTNAGWGYYLSATANTSSSNTNLTHETSSTDIFTSLSSNKPTLSDFSDNTWGYSYSTDNGTTWVSGDIGSATTGYNGLPLDNNDSGSTGIKLLNPNSYASSGSIQFKIGAKAANTQVAGTYTGTINFYAVTNPQTLPYMQDMNSTTLNYLMPNINDTTILVDKRDEQTYRVAKLKDGKYWMVENLNIAGKTTLSSDDTDFGSNYILPTTDGWTVLDNKLVLPPSSASGFSSDSYAYVYNSDNKTGDCSDSGCYSYYSWNAATLGSGRAISAANVDAPYSICPKNWKLPTSRTITATDWQTSSDFYVFAHLYGLSSVTSPDEDTAEFYILTGPDTTSNYLLSGLYNYGSITGGQSEGSYWSSTAATDNSRALYIQFTPNHVRTAGNYYRHIGRPVRCLFSDQ